jgi:hypothetical protein
MIEELNNINSEKSDLRKFGITIGVILLIIAGLLFWKKDQSFQLFFTTGAVLIVMSLTIPVILKPVYWIWMIITTIIGWVMTRIILSLVFYVILTPIGIFSRLLGKQFLGLHWDKSKNSYWNYNISKYPKKEIYEKQF